MRRILQCCQAGGSEFDFELVFASSAQSALAELHAPAKFDIAFVAIDGATEGVKIFKHLMEPSLRVPRVALTDGRDVKRIRTAIADGAIDFLIKPVAEADFISTIRRVTDQVERRRKNWRERAAYSALRREIDIAADLQRRILPTVFPQLPALDIHASMLAAQGIGGDFYDVFQIDDQHVGVVVADVAGKGIPAAFYMAVASTVIRSVALSGASPRACLQETNELLVARDIPGMFVSAFYAVVDVSSWSLVCANAGHPPPLRGTTDEAEIEPLESGGGPVLGIQGGFDYGESTLDLTAGEFLYCYTDGITEALNSERVAYGEGRLRECLRAGVDAGPQRLIGAVNQAVIAFAGDAAQHDDMTSLALKRVG